MSFTSYIVTILKKDLSKLGITMTEVSILLLTLELSWITGNWY